ncbi:MAG: adenylate/guanylate cyclase domain-containing protein [Thiomicrorhabdus sp.]|nr:adenylate/guanylate cyclase domain-containing protein [Thiomicrorhabdus sp.]
MITLLRNILILSISLCAMLLYTKPHLTSAPNYYLSDQYTKLAQTNATPQDIIILDITDSSLQFMGNWPWDRAMFTQILQQIQQQQSPKIIALDILFPEIKTPEGDLKLAKLAQQTSLCISQAFDYVYTQEKRQIGQLSPQAHHTPQSTTQLITATGFVGNYPKLAQAAHCAGHISPITDLDGLIRRYPSAVQYQDQMWSSLAQAMLQATHTPFSPIPANSKGIIRIPYAVNPHHFQMIPIEDVLFEQIPPNTFKDAFILIGSSAMGLSDRVSTPVHPWLPGVIIHAQMLYSLKNQTFTPWPFMAELTLAFTLTGLFFLLYTLLNDKLKRHYLILLGLLTAWVFISFYAWQSHSTFNLSLPFVILILPTLLIQPIQWWHSQTKNRHITRLFKNYLSAELVDQLINTQSSPLTPQQKEITILFADIEGFTALAKQLPTQQLAHITRDVLTVLTHAIQTQQGTLDKYIGDEVMAFWNAPLDQKDHAQRALDAAQKMIYDLKIYNQTHPNQPNITIRIGIDTGTVMVGDLGTNFRHSYTAIGQAVNNANRLYAYAKTHQKYIMISKNTFNQLSNPTVEPFTGVYCTAQSSPLPKKIKP